MKDRQHDNEWQAATLDRRTLEQYGRMTGALGAHHAKAPDEIAMMHEEEADGCLRERDALREEIFSGVCAWTISGGIHPEAVMQRMHALLVRFAGGYQGAVPVPERWWDEEAVAEVSRKFLEARKHTGAEEAVPGFLLSVSGKIREEADQRFVFESFRGLCRFWMCEGRTWRQAIGVHMALLKTLRPALLTVMEKRNGRDTPVMMSLDDIAVICGDAGKATVSARIKRVFNRRLEAQGMLGCFAHFQKSPEAVEKYRQAQRGNSNRRRKVG